VAQSRHDENCTANADLVRYREPPVGESISRLGSVAASSHINCETVRAYVDQLGLVQTKALLRAAGMTASEDWSEGGASRRYEVSVVSSIVPIFGGSGFDAEATQNLGKAYDTACRSLHVKGQPPHIQETLAKKIIEAAQRGERDPDRLAAIALGILGPFHRDVTRRFGLIHNFFVSAPDAPEIVEKLWDFAKSGYLDNPIPALFKERLFVFLSRFCQVRYCIVRHCGFLVGYGHSSGDASAAPQSIEQALKLLKVAVWARDDRSHGVRHTRARVPLRFDPRGHRGWHNRQSGRQRSGSHRGAAGNLSLRSPRGAATVRR
jgi:hypothetical protein